MGLGLLIGATSFGEKGKRLWLQGDKKADDTDSYGWATIVPKASFDQYIPLYRLKEFPKTIIPFIRTRTCINKVIHGGILLQQFQPSTLIDAMFLA